MSIKTHGVQRNINLDILRLIGFLIIITAHAFPPFWISQIKNFGTPLLIVVSGLTYSYIYQKQTINTAQFLRKRLGRLIIPLYIFLTFFFLFFYAVYTLMNVSFPFTLPVIIESYGLSEGIGFVWIFKYYLGLALITPISLKIVHSSISNIRLFAALLLAYIFYELLIHLTLENKTELNYVGKLVLQVIKIIPFSIMYIYGLRLEKISYKIIRFVTFISFIVFLITALVLFDSQGTFIPTERYRHPPTLYYLSYALLGINIMYYVCKERIKVNNFKIRQSIIWLSTNTLWIYLWHILAFYFWAFIINKNVMDFIGIEAASERSFINFLARSVFMLFFGITMTYFQIYVINKLSFIRSTNFNRLLSYLK